MDFNHDGITLKYRENEAWLFVYKCYVGNTRYNTIMGNLNDNTFMHGTKSATVFDIINRAGSDITTK